MEKRTSPREAETGDDQQGVSRSVSDRLQVVAEELAAAKAQLAQESERADRLQDDWRSCQIELGTAEARIQEQARLVSIQAAQLGRARDKALSSTRAKAAFLAMISHEIRTPLNGVLGMVELLLGSVLDAEQEEHVLTIRRAGTGLLELINDVLDFSKVEAGRGDLMSSDFDLRAEVENAVEVVTHAAQRKGIELVIDVGDDVPELVSGDSVRLRQVILNLVGNAVKFTVAGEVIVRVGVVDTVGPDLAVRFAVCDSGIGVPSDRIDALFEPFVQADASTARQFGGTGLGLAICKQLVELMGGEITAESEVGVGSTFAVNIPFAKSTGSVSPAPGFEGRVLVVDGHDTGRSTLAAQLERLSVEVVAVGGVEEALSALETSGALQLALVDHRTAAATPTETLKLGKELQAKRVELVLLSPLGPRSECEGSFGCSVNRTLMKPVRRGQLTRLLRSEMGSADDATLGGAVGRSPGGLEILVVEDNSMNVKVAMGLLRKLGHAVDVANNGVEGLAKLSERDFDLVLLDCDMPEMNGFEMARELRNRESSESATPLIAMTAHALAEDRQRCLDSGMNDYMAKPLTLDALERMIENWGEGTPPRAS